VSTKLFQNSGPNLYPLHLDVYYCDHVQLLKKIEKWRKTCHKSEWPSCTAGWAPLVGMVCATS